MTKLSRIIKSAKDETGRGLADLTVLAAQRDPYRLGTDAHQRNAQWLAATAINPEALGIRLPRSSKPAKRIEGTHHAST